MLPIGYASRNLFRDPSRLFQTMLGSALVVLMVMAAAAINNGLNQVLAVSGSARNIILLSAGSEESVLRSEVSERAAGIAESSLTGIRATANVRAVSPEIHQMTFLSTHQGERRQAFVRGVTPRALLVHDRLSLVDGHFPSPGQIMVGRLAWRHLGLPRASLLTGGEILVEGVAMTISGVFAAPGTLMESEVWLNLNDLRSLSLRDNLSCVVIALEKAEFADVDLFTKQRLDLELSAIRESDYFVKLASFYAPLKTMIWTTALLIAASALIGGLNTLYAAFASRIREVATLQAIGFGRTAIMFSLVQESTLACLCGALVAAVAAVSLLDGVTVAFSIGSFALRLTPSVALIGLLTGLGLGLVGAVPPGLRCLLPPVPTALGAAN